MYPWPEKLRMMMCMRMMTRMGPMTSIQMMMKMRMMSNVSYDNEQCLLVYYAAISPCPLDNKKYL